MESRRLSSETATDPLKPMTTNEQIRIEPLDRQSQLCVLVDRNGHSLGTGSREVLEVLLYIAEQCEQANKIETWGRCPVTLPRASAPLW